MPEEAPLPDLPPDIVFRLSFRDQVLAILKDGRSYPLKHAVVQALLFSHFLKVKGRYPKRRDLRALNHVCTAAAVQLRTQPAPWAGVQEARRYWIDDFMERETVIQTVRLLLRYRLLVNDLPWKGTLTRLRQELEGIATENDISYEDWPGGNHLGDHILKTLSEMWPLYNVRLTYHRKSDIRRYTLNWVDPTPVIRELVAEGRMTQDDATGTLIASPDEGDIVDEEEAARHDLGREEEPLPLFTRKPRR